MLLRGGRFSDEAIFSNQSNLPAKETASAVALPRTSALQGRFISSLTLEPRPVFFYHKEILCVLCAFVVHLLVCQIFPLSEHRIHLILDAVVLVGELTEFVRIVGRIFELGAQV